MATRRDGHRLGESVLAPGRAVILTATGRESRLKEERTVNRGHLKTNHVLVAVLLAAVLVLSLACSTAAPAAPATSAPTKTTAAPTAAAGAPAAGAEFGGQTPNNIPELEALLAQNVYVQALQNAGKEQSVNKGKVFGPNDKIRITFSLEGLSHPYLVNQAEVAKEVGRQNGAEVTIVSAEDKPEKQVSDVEAALAKGTDALMMMPASTKGLDSALKQYDEKGIPYFFATKGMDGVNQTGAVLANYAGEGKALGDFVVDYFNKKGMKNVKVGLIAGIAGDFSSVARTGMFKLSLLKSGNFQIVAEQPGQYRREPSLKIMEAWLAAHPDIQLVFGANDENALGALSAIKAAGRKDIIVVSIDGEKDIFPEIQAGYVLASYTHLPTAGIVAQYAIDYLRGKPIPKIQVPTNEELVTKEKIDAGTIKPAF